jgi:hypothetical protein
MVSVAHELVADAQDHGPVPCHQGGEGSFTSGITADGKPLEELSVGEPGDGFAIEERCNLLDYGW